MSKFSGLSRMFNLLPHGDKKATGRRTGPAADRWQTRLSFESLERREMMATTPVVFTLPPDVAGRGVQVAIYGTLALPTSQQVPNPTYTNNQGSVINNGSLVYFDNSIGDYAVPSSTSDLTFDLTANNLNQATVNLEEIGITSGVIVIGVAGPLDVTFSGGAISVPTSSTEPNGYFGLFEYSVTPDATNTNFAWNIDLSLIDQIGFPFTVSADTATSQPEANSGVGIEQYRGDLFNLYPSYIANMATYNGNAAAFQQNFIAGEGYRILASQNLVTGSPAPTFNGPTLGTGGKLTPKTLYTYWVTATSAAGESAATSKSITTNPGSNNGKPVARNTVNLSWNAIDGATGYNIYRQAPGGSIYRIASTNGSTFKYQDSGNQKNPTIASPPANSYTFNPLNSYFNDALDAFFTYYETNQFSITATFYDTTGTPPEPVYSTFTGNTVTNYQLNGTGPQYTVLQLTSTDPNFAGQDYLIFKPYFSNNTTIPGAPLAPTWMQNTSNSPGWMVFACDGVFASGSLQPGLTTTLQQTALNGIQNSIVSALNRGIATNFNVEPSAWINYPDVTGASATAGSGLSANTYYYYVVTAVSNSVESPASVMYAAQTNGSNNQITITWKPQDVYDATSNPLGVDSYNVYRSLSPGLAGSDFVKIVNVSNTNGSLTSYTDASTSTLTGSPVMYYEPGSISNWYAAFTHLNYTTNPISGVSVNGLGYGFPFDDQGNDSSDFTANNPTQINIELMPWTTRPTVPTNPTTNPLTPPPTSPWGVTIQSQPTNVKVNVTNTVKFKAYTQLGHTYFGGALVTVTLINSKGQPTVLGTVTTDPLDGEATFNFKVPTSGKYQLKFTLTNGHQIFSSIFQVVPSSLKGKKK